MDLILFLMNYSKNVFLNLIDERDDPALWATILEHLLDYVQIMGADRAGVELVLRRPTGEFYGAEAISGIVLSN